MIKNIVFDQIMYWSFKKHITNIEFYTFFISNI